MSEATAKQLNDFTLPCSLLQKPRLPLGTLFVLGDVYSFTGKDKTGKEMTCKRKYQTFKERAGVSRATVGRSLHKAREHKLLELDPDKGYVYTGEKERLFIRYDKWLFAEEFTIHKNCRKLKFSERLVFARIFTSADNHGKSVKSCKYSIAELAEATGLSEKTVQRAVWVLIRAKLIYRPLEDKGVNGWKKSTYTLNYKLIRELQKKYRKNADTLADVPAPTTAHTAAPKADRRIEIERIYTHRRADAELRAENNLARARQNEQFKQAESAANGLAIELARAEIREPGKIPQIQRAINQALREKRAAMRVLGFTDEDFKPQYKCKCCNDTGYTSDGTPCKKCFPPG